LSSIYFDVLKDRLYTTTPKSHARRSAQTAMWRVTEALVRLMAPVLTFTTEEVWTQLPKPKGAAESVHLTLFPEPSDLTQGLTAEHRARLESWERLITVRETVNRSLETARQEKLIGAPLEAKVQLKANGDLLPLLQKYERFLPSLFITSEVALDGHGEADLAIHVQKAGGVKCERCWKYTRDVGSDAKLPTVCAPCAAAVTEILGL
jgi:isoleucyl-tRNA synthetase